LKLPIGVWCNASIRVLGTRGDSSTLSSPTKRASPFYLFAQLVQDTALLTLRTPVRIRYDAPIFLRFYSSTGRARRFERRGCRFESCQEFQFAAAPLVVNLRDQNDLTPQPKGAGTLTCATRGSDVAGNMRVFQIRFESSKLSFRSNYARVAKRLRRRIANPVFVSSSLTARSKFYSVGQALACSDLNHRR
jgi:hypothetical protein